MKYQQLACPECGYDLFHAHFDKGIQSLDAHVYLRLVCSGCGCEQQFVLDLAPEFKLEEQTLES